MAKPVEIEWASATVEDGRLSVELAPSPPKGWRSTFESVLAQLGTHGHDSVTLSKRTLRVDEVSPGAEEDVRHVLESAVLQANATAGLEPDEAEDEAEPSGPDEEMTAVFRSFADA